MTWRKKNRFDGVGTHRSTFGRAPPQVCRQNGCRLGRNNPPLDERRHRCDQCHHRKEPAIATNNNDLRKGSMGLGRNDPPSDKHHHKMIHRWKIERRTGNIDLPPVTGGRSNPLDVRYRKTKTDTETPPPHKEPQSPSTEATKYISSEIFDDGTVYFNELNEVSQMPSP